MTYEEFTNTTDREFDDISTEEFRRYTLVHQDEEFIIEDPIAISVSERRWQEGAGYDRHLVVNSNGNAIRIPFNPTIDILRWETEEDSEQVVL